jgi:hypothetical protein
MRSVLCLNRNFHKLCQWSFPQLEMKATEWQIETFSAYNSDKLDSFVFFYRKLIFKNRPVRTISNLNKIINYLNFPVLKKTWLNWVSIVKFGMEGWNFALSLVFVKCKIKLVYIVSLMLTILSYAGLFPCTILILCCTQQHTCTSSAPNKCCRIHLKASFSFVLKKKVHQFLVHFLLCIFFCVSQDRKEMILNRIYSCILCFLS